MQGVSEPEGNCASMVHFRYPPGQGQLSTAPMMKSKKIDTNETDKDRFFSLLARATKPAPKGEKKDLRRRPGGSSGKRARRRTSEGASG